MCVCVCVCVNIVCAQLVFMQQHYYVCELVLCVYIEVLTCHGNQALPDHPGRNRLPNTPTNQPFAGTTPSSATRLRPVDRHVPMHRQRVHTALREMNRPAPSGAGIWPKPQPFIVCQGPQFRSQATCRYWSSDQCVSSVSPRTPQAENGTIGRRQW